MSVVEKTLLLGNMNKINASCIYKFDGYNLGEFQHLQKKIRLTPQEIVFYRFLLFEGCENL